LTAQRNGEEPAGAGAAAPPVGSGSRFAWLVQVRPDLAATLLDSVAEAVVVVDRGGRFLGSNPAANRLLGIGVHHVSPEEWSEAYGLHRPDGGGLFPKEELPLVRAIRGESVEDVEILIRNPRVPQGVFVSASAQPLHAPDGTIQGGVVVLRDITARRRYAEELREETAFLDLLTKTAVAANEAETMEEAFRRALEIVGMAAGWDSGQAFLTRPPPQDAVEFIVGWASPARAEPGTGGREGSDSVLRQVLSTGRPHWIVDVSDDGTGGVGRRASFAFPVLVGREAVGVVQFQTSRPLEPDPRLLEIMGNVGTQLGRVVERQRNQAALEDRARELARSNEDLEQFAYVASHELKEPVRTLGNHLEAVAKAAPGRDASIRTLLESSRDVTRRMKGLIDDLLAFSRIGREARPLSRVDTEIVLEQAVQSLEAAIADAGATVTNDLLPTVLGDESQVLQLFVNLLSNAVKFHGRAPPRVHVSARLEGEEWVFSVRDNGIGIAPEDQGRIFTIFQRLHAQSEYPGTGIGLALCKRIVERHGGRIWVESQVGEGSIFQLILRRVPEGVGR